MRAKTIEENGRTLHVAVLAEGDEAVEQLGRLVKDAGITAAQVTGVGAFERAVVGWFDREAKDYRRNGVDEQCEVLSLIGDVAVGPDGTPSLHAHVVLGLKDGTTRGGHLLEGHGFPTLEVVLDEPPATLRKRARPDLGLALIDPTTGKNLADLPFSFPTYENGVPTTRKGWEFNTKTAFTFSRRKAAFIMRGDNDCATGLPATP